MTATCFVAGAQVEFLRPMTVSVLSERRTLQPFGLEGGASARPGLNLLQRKNGRCVNLGGKATLQLEGGEHLRLLTPGDYFMHCIVAGRLPAKGATQLAVLFAADLQLMNKKSLYLIARSSA